MVNKLFDFINSATTCYQTVEVIRARLLAEGYVELCESDVEDFCSGEKCFTVRGGSSLIAFRGKGSGFMITASHSDSPCFKLKTESGGVYLKLETEKYGGSIHYSWLDRPISIAGRIVAETDDGVISIPVDLRKSVAIIPSLAIHLNRDVNESCKFNPAVDLIPLVGLQGDESIMSLVAQNAGVEEGRILSHDLYVYNAEQGRLVGSSDSLILSPRLDDLECVFSALEGFLAAEDSDDSVSVLSVFNNEEIGSSTREGANSTFLDSTLCKIAGDDVTYARMLENSFMISADNAHAIHPNHPELSDRKQAPVLGGGVVVKYNANCNYTTSALSDAILRKIAAKAGLSLQSFSTRSDMRCGSTLGSIASTRVSVLSADVGLPQLAMHSASETAACSDLKDMISLITAFYSASLKKRGEGYVIENK